MKLVQSVTVRVDDDEELQAMHSLIQRWTMNGWTVKNITQFSRSEGALGGLFGQASSYSTIIFEKEDSSICPICNITVNGMKLHREWHTKKESANPGESQKVHKYEANLAPLMSPMWNAKPPKNDDEFFERMSRSLFTAGLNWKVIEKKWPNFQKAFADFSISKVAKFSDKDVKRLMTNEGIVRNEKKIQATVHNAGEFLKLEKEFGSFQKYLDSFGKDEERMLEAVQERFQHVGASTARTFLWASGCELSPTRDEKKWMASHKS